MIKNSNLIKKIRSDIKSYFRTVREFSLLNYLVRKHKGVLIFVGGAVRSIILGQNIKDYDAEVYSIDYDTLKQVLEDFATRIDSKIIYVGVQFGVFKIIKLNLDVSLPRTELSTGLKHRDFKVEFDVNINYEKASLRRDFKMNSIGYSLTYNHILDPNNGLEDIHNKEINIVFKEEKFLEDPLRILRAIYFSNKLNFKLSDSLKKLIEHNSHLLVNISIERIAIEIYKTLKFSNLKYIHYINLIKNIDIEFINALKYISSDKIGITLIQNLNTFQERLFFILINNFNQNIIDFVNKMQDHKANNIQDIIILAGIYHYNYVNKNNKLLNNYLRRIKQYNAYTRIVNFAKENLQHQFIYKYAFKIIKFIHIYIINVKSFNARQIWKNK